MRKKGFTLIELLAVILILGIIALIAIPTVTGIINESSKQAFKVSVQELVSTVSRQCQREKMKGLAFTNHYSFTSAGPSTNIDTKGMLPTGGNINIDNNCNTEIAVSNKKYCVTKSFDEDTVKIAKLVAGTCMLEEIIPLCKKATTLHTEDCNYDYNTSCYEEGYNVTGFHGTKAISYGQIGVSGVLSTGDAFDCDVNGDGTYDPVTERFYYVSDYYNTFTRNFEKDKATLIYHTNTRLGEKDDTSAGAIGYYEDDYDNTKGPLTAMTYLPTVTQWSNVTLINNVRKVLPEVIYATYTDSASVDYTGYAARLLTTQELEKACGISVEAYENIELNEYCLYLSQNSRFEQYIDRLAGFWLETYYSESDGAGEAWHSSYFRSSAGVSSTTAYEDYGVRPVIEVLKDKIDY